MFVIARISQTVFKSAAVGRIQPVLRRHFLPLEEVAVLQMGAV